MPSDTALRHVTGLDEADLQSVLALVAGTDVRELEIVYGESRISLSRDVLATEDAAQAPSQAGRESEEPAADLPVAITSPLVGRFRPSVSVGQFVRQGQRVGAIEALGLPTTVDAPREGTIEEVLVGENGPVEYGQPLLVLRPDPARETSP